MVCDHRLAGWLHQRKILLGGMALLESDRVVGKYRFLLAIHCAMDRYGKAQTCSRPISILVVKPGRNAIAIELRPL